MPITLPTESATYAKWMLEQQVKRLEKDRDAALRRARANVVAARPEQHIADALERAARELRKAHADINPTQEHSNASPV